MDHHVITHIIIFKVGLTHVSLKPHPFPLSMSANHLAPCFVRITTNIIPESKVHGANMGLIWGRQDPGGPRELCYLGCTVVPLSYWNLTLFLKIVTTLHFTFFLGPSLDIGAKVYWWFYYHLFRYWLISHNEIDEDCYLDNMLHHTKLDLFKPQNVKCFLSGWKH